MLSAIWRICFFECVRALRGLGLSASGETHLISYPSEAFMDALIWRLPVLTMAQLSFLGTSAPDQGSAFEPGGELVGGVDQFEYQDRRRDKREVGDDID